MADYAIHDTTLIGISNVIRKKEGSSALIDPAEYAERVNLMGMLEEKTASSASICSFSDGADDVPMYSVVAHIAPTLTGTNAVNMVQTRKNLVVLSDDYYYDSQRCSYIYENGGISVTASGTYARVGFLFTLKAGIPYTISFNASTSGDYGHFYLSESAPFSGQFANITLTGTEKSYTRTFTLNGTSLYIGVYVTATGTTGDTIIKNIQLEVGSTATTYEPYTEPTSYTANLGRTVYGADVDLVSGHGKEQYGKIVFDGTEGTGGTPSWTMISVTQGTMFRITVSDKATTSATNTLCSYYTPVAQAQRADGTVSGAGTNVDIIDDRFSSVDAFKAWLAENPVTLVYELSSEASFTFDGQEIPSLLGVNNLWHDAGETEAVYRSSGTVTPVPIQPVLISKTITENGTYSAEDDNADGYDEVTVNVEGGGEPFVPEFSETKIADNSSHASSFTLSEDYANYDMVKIVWYESASSSGFLYTTPDILDEIFSVGVGKLCINKPSTNYYACYTKSGLTWTRSNQRVIDVHEIYGVTFTNCTMTATDLYKRGASTTTKIAITSQTSLKDYDLFMMASIHATDGSETMPSTWLYQYPPENMSEAFSCPVPAVLQEYDANDEAFVISEYGMTSARFFMVQGIKFTPTPSLLSMSLAPTPSEPDSEDPEEEVEEEET